MNENTWGFAGPLNSPWLRDTLPHLLQTACGKWFGKILRHYSGILTTAPCILPDSSVTLADYMLRSSCVFRGCFQKMCLSVPPWKPCKVLVHVLLAKTNSRTSSGFNTWLIAFITTKEALQFHSCQLFACWWKLSHTVSKHEWLFSFFDKASLKYSTARLLGAKSKNTDFWNSDYL